MCGACATQLRISCNSAATQLQLSCNSGNFSITQGRRPRFPLRISDAISTPLKADPSFSRPRESHFPGRDAACAGSHPGGRPDCLQKWGLRFRASARTILGAREVTYANARLLRVIEVLPAQLLRPRVPPVMVEQDRARWWCPGQGRGYTVACAVPRVRPAGADSPGLAKLDVKQADRPDFVTALVLANSRYDSHSSRRRIAPALKLPTRTLREPPQRVPIWDCSRWRLPRFTVT